MKKTLPLVALVFLFFITNIHLSAQTGEAFSFDGANDVITVPNIALNNQSFTIEFWAKRNSSNPANCYAISQGPSGNYQCLQIGFVNTNTLKFGFWNDDIDVTNAACSDGQYHHWACVYKYGVAEGFNRFIYLDGNLLYAQRSFTTYQGTGTFYIGRNISAGGYFNGLLDEVRVWSTARSQCEIQTYKDCEIPGTAPGLLANYHFNQGIASGANSTQTLVTDDAGAYTGTLTGAALTGTSSNWVAPGGVTSGNNTTTAPTSSITITGNGNAVTSGATSASLSNFTDFGTVFTRTFVISNTGSGTLNIDSVKILGAGLARFSIVSFPGRTISTGTTAVVVAFNPNAAITSTASINILTNDCNNPLFTFVISGTGVTGAALAFAGSHTLTIPHSTAFNVTTALTLETWVKATYSGESYITSKNDDSWYLAISGAGGAPGKASFYLNGITTSGWLYGTTTISDGNWHHVAATYDGSMMRLYVDGNLEAQAAATGIIQSGINTVRLGSRTNASPFNFTGSMDEVRIWNTTRSQCDIQRYMNCEIPTNASGLVANYHFNQGIAGGNNTGTAFLTSSAGGNTGTLSNFALTGTTSNWVAPGAVVSNYNTVSSNSPTITVRGNSNVINNGSTSASTTNFTDFGALTTRTFVISNAAGSTLTIGRPYITGAQASDFSVTTLPSASINPSGTSSFVVTFIGSAASTRTATINFVTNDCAAPVFNFVVSGTPLAGAALNFDGSNDYIKRSEPNFGTGNFAIEMWIRPTSFSQEAYLASNRTSEFSGQDYWFALLIQQSSGALQFAMGECNLPGVAAPYLVSPASLTLNVWQHVAVSRTGALFGLYINGILVASGSDGGLRDLTSQSGNNTMTFGAWGPPLNQRFFRGDMDEVRVWKNGSRSGCLLQQFINSEIPTIATNLIANYHFNQGVAGGNNTGITNVTDASGTANAVFNNFALNGTISNFVATGGVVTNYTTVASVTASVSVSGNGNNISNGSVSPLSTNFTDFGTAGTRTFVISNNTGTLNAGKVFFTDGSPSEFSVTVLPASVLNPSASTTLVIAFTPTSTGTKSTTVNFGTNDCAKPWFSYRISATAAAAAALDFSNANTNIIAVPNISLNNQSFTIEFWAKRSNSNDDNYIVGQGTPSQNNALHIGFRNSNEFTFAFHTNDLNVSNAACTDGLYHHWACVYKAGTAGSNRLIYLDGKLIAADNAAAYMGTGTFYIGNSTLGTPDYFNGSVDELRVWNSIRSQCDIQTYMNCEIATTATGLTANYHFNQGYTAAGNPTVTTLTDATGSGHNGTLSNFSLTGTTSNWTSPGGVTSNYTTTAAPSVSITLRGNSNTITNGSTSPLTSNWTDYGAVSSRTFVITNTGTGTLNVGPTYLTGANASDFSITVQPAANITTGTASLFVTFTPTAAGTRTAMINIPNSDCSKPVFSFVIQGSTIAGAALSFDGSDDQVIVSNTGLLSNFGIAPFTMEAWVYPTSLSNERSIIRKDGDYNLLLINGLVQAEAFPSGSGGGTVIRAVSATSVSLNQWTHLAAVWNGSAFTVYVNGLAVNTTTNSATTGASSWLSIGRSVSFSQPFQGNIDEVRLWKTGRTQCEIQSFMNCEIPAAASNLVANYHFNQGVTAGNNTAIISLTDLSGNNHTGTLTAFALTGATSNWVTPGGVVSDYTTTAVNPSTMAISGNGNTIPNGSTGTSTSNNTNFNGISTQTFVVANNGGTLYINSITLSGGNASSFSVTSSQSFSLGSSNANILTIAYTPTAAGASTAIVNVSSSNCTAPNYSFVITASVAPGAALKLDGANDYLSRSLFSIANSSVTMQARVLMAASSASDQVIVYNGNTSTSGYGFFAASTTREIMVLYGGNIILSTGYILPLNQWTALSVVLDNGNIRVYANGLLVHSSSPGIPAAPSGSFLVGGNNLGSEIFNGAIDEVLLWTKALTQCEIQTNIDSEIPGSATSLLANYHFNQGLAGVNNATVTTATDASGNNYNLTLNNFALSGTISNWVTPGAVVSGYTTTSAVSSTLSVSGNGNSIPNGSTGTSTLNNTNFNGAATQTFVIANTGANLYVNSITLSGGGAASFSVTSAQSFSLGSSASNLLIAYTPATAGTGTAIVTINTSNCSVPAYSFVITASVSTASALDFNGTTSHISTAGLSLNNQSFTIEFWAKRNNNSVYNIALSQGTSSQNLGLHVGFQMGNFFMMGFYSNDLIVPHSDLLWHHWACVYKTGVAAGTNNRFIYRDGILIASDHSPSDYLGSGSMNIGKNIFSTDYFDGRLDEMRIWNTARTQCEIQQYMNCEIPTTAPNLLANYHFNQGVAGLANPTVTTLIDAAGSTNGSLYGFALTGTVSNWVSPGGVVNDYTVAASVTASISLSGNSNVISNNASSTSSLNFTDFNGTATRIFVITNTGGGTLNIAAPYFNGANSTEFSVTAQPALTLAAGATTSLTVVFTPTAGGIRSASININSSDCSKPLFSFLIQGITPVAEALGFNGSNSYVDLGASNNVKPATALTAEAWVYRASWPGTDQTILGNTESAGYGLFIKTTGELEGLVHRNSAFASVTTPLSGISTGWHHVALTYNGRITTLYLDGAVKSVNDAGASYPIDYIANNTLLGAEASSGSAPVPGWYFTGRLDEVRFWNTARTQCEIQSYMSAEIPTTAPGLVANYHFNQGSSGLANPTVTTLTDATTANTGTLNGFALTGTVSNWVSPGGVVSGYTTVSTPSAEIDILGNGASIANNDLTPSLSDNTDFGSVCLNTAVTKNFTIQNTGTSPLSVTSLTVSGINASLFSLTATPATITAGGSSTISITFSATTTGVKNATVNITSNDCDEALYTFAITGSVSPSPTITTSNGMICSGQSYTLTASGASTYTYSGGQVVSPVSSTNYSITGTSADGCAGSNTAVATVIVNAIPPVSVSGTGTICSSGNSNFTASGAVTYTWSTGDTGPMVTLSPTITTTYTVTGAYANGCSNTAVKTLSVYTTPTISVNSGTICYGQSFTIAPTGAATYSYMNGGPVVSPTVITSYSLTGTSAQGCTSFPESISTVTVLSLPTVNIINYAICSGSSVNLNPSGAVSYTFQGGSAVVSPTTTTTYTVAGSNAQGCVATATTTVTVYNSPTLSIAASNTAICEGAAATLTVSGAMSYLWSNAATTNTVSVSPATSTGYTVTGTDANGCIGSAASTIVVNALPTITVPNGTICPGNVFTLTPSGANTYSYSSITNTVLPATTTSYSISGTSTAGCVSSASAVATVYVINTLTVSVTGNTTICNGQTTTLTAGGATTYSWTNGDLTSTVALSPSVNTTYTVYGVSGTCSNNAVVSISVNATPTISVNSGTICAGQVFTMNPSGAVNYVYSSTSNTVSPLVYTTYSVSGTGANGCVSTTSAISTVSVNALPTLTIATTSTAVCSGSSATLTASGALNYLWSNAATTSTIGVTPAANTGYTVTGTDANGCIGSAASTIVVNALPTITVPNGTICPGNVFTLTPSGANTYSYSSITNTVLPATTTSYSISGTSTAGCVSSASAMATVNVINSLTVTVTGNTLICNGQTTTLTAGGATTYSWTNGALTSTVALSPTANTTYTVYGVSGTCSNNAIVSVSVNATPTISVNSGTICAGQVFTMTPSGAVNYVYSSTSNTVSPLVYTTYSVSGTGANGCVSTTSAISTVSVNALPALTIAASSASVCDGAAATLTVSGANSYVWNNNSSLNTNTLSVTPLTNTTYSVSGTDANGCTGFTTQLIAVNPLPTISLNGGAICPGASFTLNPSGASTYTFSGGNAIVSPLANTDYSVAGTSALGCVSSISAVATVSVVSTLTVSVSGATTICSGQTATLTAGGATTYSWSTGVTTDSITLSPSTTTDYTVYAFSGSCMDKALVTVSVNPLPAISVSSGTVCSGSSFTLNPSGAVSYSYTGGSAVVSPTINTSYSVTGTDANGCVSASPAVASITVSALPALTMAISEPSVCAGATTQVSASGANTYSWSTAATTASITVTPSTTAVYSVTGTDILGCSNTGTIEAVVKAMPTLTLTKSQPGICMGGSVTMTVSGADTYTWSTGSASSTIVISPSVTSTYSVTGTLQGCEARAVETISIFAQPTLAISGVATICKKGTAMITASGATTYSWSNGESSALVALSPSANTTYTVTGSNSHACSDTATFTITVDKTCTDSLLPVKIFSGITPNGDNVNDFWNIKNIEDYPKNRVTVYNRWGTVVAEISGYDNANRLWPTADEAGKLSPSTYYYIIELGDGSKPIKGWVEIVKD